MLESIRKSVSGILAKILIGLLVVSFAVWGIGDMVRSYGRDVVATVGDRQISTNEFRQAYQIQVANFSEQFGRRLTPQEAKVLGIEQQVVQRLTGAAAVDSHGDTLGLDISDVAVERAIVTDPVFRGLDGNFSAAQLQELLRRSGYTEAQYFEARKRDTIRDQLTASLLSGIAPPAALKDMLVTFQREQRVADYVEVKPEAVVSLPEPGEDDLKKAFETNKRRFMVPEFRQFDALLLTRDAVKAKLEITDEELKSTYEAEKGSFMLPEQRRIEQIAFPDKAAAEKALAEIRAGKDYIEVAKAAGMSEKDIDLGLLTRAAMIDARIADAAFALEKDAVSDVVEGQLATVLLRVTQVQEGRQRPFDDVKNDIRDQLSLERVGDKFVEIQNAIDDNRLAGKSLKEIAETLALPFVAVAATNREGLTPEGKPAIERDDATRLVQTAFRAEVGVENEVIELADDGLAWLNLVAVTPEKEKPFDDVREEVRKVWAETETATKLREATDKLVDRVNAGTSLTDIATELGTTVKTTEPFRRGDSLTDLSAAAVSRAFAMPPGRAAAAEGTGPGDVKPRVIIEVTKVLPPEPLVEAQAKALDEELTRAMSADIVEQYVGALQQSLEIAVNQSLIDSTTGASATLN